VPNVTRLHFRDERGATAVEYALMVSLIALVIFGAVVALGGSTRDLFDCVATSVNDLPDAPAC